ncbi:methyltransferase domain-containing protein [Janibacter sp. DB-40]|uniref:methyltransferase domain-containing protein n=1 Tax=Janibacter sp. DB-40 TaxID=3028808 RepID=UPI0024070026|nr:methyltransferase domain-containing protein [Janibacter sp. DB-40]
MTVRVVPLLQAVLLFGLALATAWGVTGWLVAIAAAVVLDGFAMVWMRRYQAHTLAPADMVTIGRATLTCAVAALVVESLTLGELLETSPWTASITVLAGVSLSLDLVDGWVARGTGRVTPFGARFDGEADAALMLVLSVWVAPVLGWWVLAIGLARYAFASAGWVLPWMRAQLPPRYWRKVVTAVTSTILVVATAGVVPSLAMVIALLMGLALIAESFGRDIWWLWRHRDDTEDVLQEARRGAYGLGEFVDQQGFMRASEILELAAAADIGTGTRVLDLCCGRGGPGRLVAQESGCELLGVDADAAAVAVARDDASAPQCSYEIGHIPPVPPGTFDVVLLLETMLAFRNKDALLREVHAALAPGGRFAFTVEEGQPLDEHERAAMPAADTVWPIPLNQLHELLERTGFGVTWQRDRTEAHLEVVDSLLTEFRTLESTIAAQLGREELEALVTSHRLWRAWLRTGRVRKFAVVAVAQPVRRGSGVEALTPQDTRQRSDNA